MSFRDFVKKHFPLNHSTAMKPTTVKSKAKQKRRTRTISGFNRGDSVCWERFTGTVTRTSGRYVYIRPNDGSWEQCIDASQVQFA